MAKFNSAFYYKHHSKRELQDITFSYAEDITS